MEEYEVEINYINFDYREMQIGWSAKHIGFGVLTIYQDAIDKYIIDSETMPQDFVDKVLYEAALYLRNNGSLA